MKKKRSAANRWITGISREFAFGEQVRLILADARGAQLIGSPVEVASKILDCTDICPPFTLREITTLELFEHVWRRRVTGTSFLCGPYNISIGGGSESHPGGGVTVERKSNPRPQPNGRQPDSPERAALEALVEAVVGAAYGVSNVLGAGFLEKLYE